MSETYYEKRKARKLAEQYAAEQAAKLKDLAANILTENEPAVEEMDDAPEVLDDPKTYGSIPSDKEEVVEVRKPVDIPFGLTKTTAFILEKRLQEMYNILGNLFGTKTGDYFIGSENTVTVNNLNQRKRYKCIVVEDKHSYRYVLWFDVTKLGMIY